MHSALSCSFRKRFPIFRYHTYDIIPLLQERSLDFARDDDTGIALSKHIRCMLQEINLFPPPSFRAQREIFLALCSFLLLSQKGSPFPLSHIRHYPLLQERSLHFGRDDDTGISLSKHIRCTLREINPFPPYRHFERSREIFLALCSFLLLSQKVPPFPLSHILRYTSMQERSLDCARDDDTGIALSQHILYTIRGISPPMTQKKKAPAKAGAFFVRKTYLPNCASMVPAATAVPITPATFGPIACISR